MYIIILDSMPKRLIQKVMSDKAVMADHEIRINLEIQNRKNSSSGYISTGSCHYWLKKLPLFQN